MFATLEALGIDYDDVVQVLEDEGVSKFEASWNEMLADHPERAQPELLASRHCIWAVLALQSEELEVPIMEVPNAGTRGRRRRTRG